MKRRATKTSGKHYQALVELAKLNTFSDEKVFIENATIARHHVKKRIISRNLIPYICAECSINGNWNGKELVLQLDHINGINNDNRLENLRFLCPNCHSQQKTYAAKNRHNTERNPKPYYKSKSIS